MQSYDAVEKEVDLITDGLGMPVDDRIKKTIIALRMMRVNTNSSCEGHEDRGCPYPWVGVYAPKQYEPSWIKANLAERDKVEPLVNEFNALHAPKYPLIIQDWGVFGAFRIQSFYWQKEHEVDPSRLEEYQQVMDAFAEYIISKTSLSS